MQENTQNLPTVIDGLNPESWEDRFISYLSTCKTIRAAGIKAGYSESYSKTNLCDKFKNQAFLNKLKTYYNGYSASLLPKILHAESKVVDIVLNDPEKLPKFSRTLKELKQSAGVLQQDQAPGSVMINIENMQNILKKVHEWCLITYHFTPIIMEYHVTYCNH